MTKEGFVNRLVLIKIHPMHLGDYTLRILVIHVFKHGGERGILFESVLL